MKFHHPNSLILFVLYTDRTALDSEEMHGKKAKSWWMYAKLESFWDGERLHVIILLMYIFISVSGCASRSDLASL